MRHNHATPFEMVEFKFHVKLPIFVERQWARHRTASWNEMSLRYTEAKDEFYIPERFRKQSTSNKQGGDEFIDSFKDVAQSCFDRSGEEAMGLYQTLLGASVSKELARCVLPVSGYTEKYWKCDLRNLLHLLGLRCDSHAQYEIRVYADAMLRLITPLVPWSVEAWNDYHPLRGGMLLSRMEVANLKRILDWYFQNSGVKGSDMRFDPDDLFGRELAEWKRKLEHIYEGSD